MQSLPSISRHTVILRCKLSRPRGRCSLPQVRIKAFKRVTDEGVIAMANNWPELVFVSLHNNPGIHDESVKALCSSCPRLRYINVSLTSITERSLRILADTESLRCVLCPILEEAYVFWIICGLMFVFLFAARHARLWCSLADLNTSQWMS